VFTGTNAVVNVQDSSSFAGIIQKQGPTDQVNVSCYAAGMRLAIEHGERKVEDLRVRDRVRAMPGDRLVPIVWIRYRHIDCARHADPASVWPVRVRAGALGHETPHRNLFLSPDHGVFVDGFLVPVRYLISGSTIAQRRVSRINYYHVELPEHDLPVAEGAVVESYLGPDGVETAAIWATRGCADLVVTGPRLDNARGRTAADSRHARYAERFRSA
jgi:hypothetical protein